MSELRRVVVFNLTLPSTPGKVSASVFRCECKKGVMFDVTSKLAEAMGVLHHECDICHMRVVTKLRRGEEK